MRILGHIDHPQLKITVFKMDNRISVKFESPLYEQTYKLGQDDRLNTLEAITNLIDPEFIHRVQETMQQMHRTRLEALPRAFPLAHESDTFEEII